MIGREELARRSAAADWIATWVRCGRKGDLIGTLSALLESEYRSGFLAGRDAALASVRDHVKAVRVLPRQHPTTENGAAFERGVNAARDASLRAIECAERLAPPAAPAETPE